MEEKLKLKSTPKDVFLHLFNIFTFYLSVVAFITLYIQYIAAMFPDPLNFYFTAIANSVRWASAVLFVSVPSYLITSWLFAKDFVRNPEKRDLKLRRWLIHFTLFIAAITIIIDLMIFIYNFLSGELTIQFFFKILTVLLVAVSVFGYYIWDLKRTDLQSKIPKILSTILSVVVFGSIIAGFFVVGTPAEQRRGRFDEQRTSDLQMLQGQITNYWMQKEVLPSELKLLEDDISGFIIPSDPSTGGQYEYRLISDLTFELCAVYEGVSDDIKHSSRIPSYPAPYYDKFQQNWSHGAERTCFERTIDPELYKKQNLNAIEAAPIKVPPVY